MRVCSYACCTGGAFRTVGRLHESYSEVAIQITLDRTVPSWLLLDTLVPNALLKNALHLVAKCVKVNQTNHHVTGLVRLGVDPISNVYIRQRG